MLKPENRLPFFVAVGIGAAIAFAILMTSHNPHINHGEAYQTAQSTSDYGPWWSWPLYSGFWIAWFTVILTGSTIALWKLARDEFYATHRPHLVVRNIRAIDADPGEPIKIGFEVINIGTSDALIIASAFETRFIGPIGSYDEDPPPIVGTPPKNFMGTSLLKVNAVWRGRVFEGDRKWTTDDFHDGEINRGFFFGGKILYRDSNGENRRLGIFRRLSPSASGLTAFLYQRDREIIA